MNQYTACILRVVAERNGLRISFRQEPDGLWIATWRVGKRNQLWAGTLLDMFLIAKGKKLHET